MSGLNQSEEIKRVLFVDPNCTPSSPSMKGILNSLPHLVEAGYRPVFWCWAFQGEEEGVELHQLPLAGLAEKAGPLSSYIFSCVANCYGLWQKIKKAPRAVFTFSTGFYYLGADAALIHFSQYDWINRQKQIGIKGGKDLLNLLRAGVNLLRIGNRQEMRESYGIEEAEVVFSFVCMGHYERKGYWLALEALSILRKEGQKQLKFLVIGGKPETLQKLQEDTATKYPDYEQWVIYTGMVSEVEKALSASDGFLFPSYSEAFSLVEIEASLLGLPLYLTPHHGSEMILEDGVNGRLLEFNPRFMAETLKEELKKPLQPGSSYAGRALSQSEYAEALLRVVEENQKG